MNCILLIDDNEATNYYHKIVLESAGCAETVISLESAQEALAYLQQEDAEHPTPDLIFLDLNMPEMNGWEFLDECCRRDLRNVASTPIVILSTSLNPDDRERAQKRSDVADFMNKPLSCKKIDSLLQVVMPARA